MAKGRERGGVITSMAARISGRRNSKRRAERRRARVEHIMHAKRGCLMLVTVTRAYKTELALNDRQVTACKRHAGAPRDAYNWGLAQKQAAYAANGTNPCAIHPP